MNTKRLAILIVGAGLAISSTFTYSQQLDSLGPPPGFDPSESVDDQVATPPPPDAAVRYPVGEAPFYAAISSYILLMYPLYEGERTRELQREADALQLSLEEYGEVLSTLNLYRARELEDFAQRQRALCEPILLGGDVSNEDAIEALRALDNDAASRNDIADGVMRQVGDEFGGDVEARVREYLDSYRAAMSFSRTDIVKFVELQTDVDHRTFFTNLCQSI